MRQAALRALGLVAALGAVGSALAQDQFKFDYIGIEVGAYFPSSGTVRDSFGNTVTRLGISPIMNRRTPDWRLSYEFGFIGASGSGDKMAIIPVTVGLQKSFATDDNLATYVRAGIGLAYFDYEIGAAEDTKIDAATALEFGILGNDRFKVSARWYLFPKQDGIDFSGFLLSASYGFFKL